MKAFIWHEPSEIPGAPIIVKTNLMNYFVGAYYDSQYWLKNGRRYDEATRLLGAHEQITGWAYIGGEGV